MKYKWQPTYDEENGWYITRMIYMNPPETIRGTYETEEEAQKAADAKNEKESL